MNFEECRLSKETTPNPELLDIGVVKDPISGSNIKGVEKISSNSHHRRLSNLVIRSRPILHYKNKICISISFH